jgi:threonine dehydratase
MQVPDGYFVHPVLDQKVMAGNGTAALEIIEGIRNWMTHTYETKKRAK